MSALDSEGGKDAPGRKDKSGLGLDATKSGGVSVHDQTSTLSLTTTGQSFSGQDSSGAHQHTAPTQVVARTPVHMVARPLFLAKLPRLRRARRLLQ